jgi:4-diphosphocytidyl-2-C-methyl-D-erythritol kinase
MAAEGSLRVTAHAKLNLGLAVLGRRADGFHEIDTLFVRVELHDELWLERAPLTSAELVRQEEAALIEELPMDADNLVLRAVEAYRRAVGRAGRERIGGVRIGLAKRIPVSAGLGGGSSDAAAVLLGLAWLYPRGVDLHRLALELGSDVPFFLGGHAAARGRGRGERLEPLYLPRFHVVLANPRVAVRAAEAYARLEAFSRNELSPERIAVRVAAGEEPGLVNSLQAGVVEAYPVVGDVLDELRRARLRGVSMSGSGSTCFGLAGSGAEAREAERRLRAARPDWWVWSGPAAG